MTRIFLLLFFVCCGVAQASDGKILVLGDSLSAAYGIDQRQGWVALLEQQLMSSGFKQQLVNASISGETTAGGLRRLPSLLQKHQPSMVLIELGANDGLRAQSLDQMQHNLQQMVLRSQAAGAQVLIFEMRIPPNYGVRYTQSFRARFSEVANKTGAQLIPFFLAPIAADPAHFQADGIHPSAAAQPVLKAQVWPYLEAALKARQLAEERPLSASEG